MSRVSIISLLLTLPLWAQPPAEDIRGEKPLIEIPAPEQAPTWPLITWIAVAVLLIAAGIFWWLRRKQRPEISAEQWAQQELDELQRTGSTLPPSDFALAASRVVRVFVQRKFGLAAPKRTTEEFLQELALSKNTSLVSRMESLRGFLKSCDMAKFAGANLPSAERENLVANAKAFVESPPEPKSKEAA